MNIFEASILGVVEGLTEFVPVSSTGHLILVGSALGLGGDPVLDQAVDAFDIVIQAGAWLACVLYYLPLLRQRLRDLRDSDPVARRRGMHLIAGMAIAFVPVAVVGLIARKPIKELFFGPAPVAIALAVGGLVMIVADRWFARRSRLTGLEHVSPRRALAIGAFQCFALVPGTSRSMATMVGGLIGGLDARTAADFSFLLAIPVLGAATAYELLKEWHVLVDHIGPAAIATGLVTSFVVGWASIAIFLRLIERWGLVPFGVYRIVLAAVVWWALAGSAGG